jgi:hypothetical protein
MEADGFFGRAPVLPKLIADVVARRSLFGTFDQAEQIAVIPTTTQMKIPTSLRLGNMPTFI